MKERWIILLEMILASTCVLAEKLDVDLQEYFTSETTLFNTTEKMENFTDDSNFVRLPGTVLVTRALRINSNVNETVCTGALVDENIVIVSALHVQGYEKIPTIFSVVAKKLEAHKNVVISRTVIKIKLGSVRLVDHEADYAALYLSEPITEFDLMRAQMENETIITSHCLVSSLAKSKIEISEAEKKLQTSNWESYYQVQHFNKKCEVIMELRMKLNQRNGCLDNFAEEANEEIDTSLLFCPVKNSANYALVGTVTWYKYVRTHDFRTLISVRPARDWILDEIASQHWYTNLYRMLENLVS